MTDVDAVRLLASEHNLEFVDLDAYSVDPSVAAVVPDKVARAHGVVPIGRKFGAPVIAIGDPADIVATDTLRATIGREFISVVALPEQIERCIERVYSHPGASAPVPAPSPVPAGPAVAGLPDPVSAALSTALDRRRSVPAPLGGQPPLPPLEPRGLPFLPDGAVPPPPGASPVARQPVPPSTADAPLRSDAAVGAPAAAAPPGRDLPGIPPPISSAYEAASLPPFPGGIPGAAAVDDVPWTVATPDDPDGPASGAGDTGASAGGGVAPAPLASEPGAGDTGGVVPAGQEDAADLFDEAVARYEQSAASAGSVSLDGDLGAFPPLARVLVEGDRVPIDAMREALFEHERTGQSLARTLTSMGLVTEADLMWGMATEMGLEFVDLDLAGVDLTAAYALPEASARYHHVMVIGERDGAYRVATANPTNVLARDDLRTILGRKFSLVVATRSQISGFLDRAYSQGGNAADVATSAAGDFAQDVGGEEIENIQAVVDEAPIVRYVNLLILQAINERASDIHVEPTADNLRIRYRIDGVLHDMSTAPRSIAAAVTTRLKVMAEMNIAEHRIPQDGRISLKVGTRGIDLRMATLPTIYGEKIVMRVLDKSNVVLSFEELGFDPDLLDRYRGVYTKPYGTILVTGPTGSGKTTTLYATLSALNSPEKNIITVEDPVELRIKGINQVQLNVKAGLTFASALRSILRADPDIVLVGEIRDRETALISVEAALTGHLVLATLHTNDAASTPMRLVEMGLEPYLVSTAASAVVAQRLARRLCQHCREPFEPTESEIVAAGWRPEELADSGHSPKLYRAVGCSACAHTGYRGRKALAELLVVTEEVEHMIVDGGSADDIHRLAVEQGMVTLRQSGLRRALEGETTLEEVLRVVA